MAAELLRHQSSIAYYDSKHSGCMWGWLHHLDLHRHHHRKKMLTYKHTKGTDGGGTRTLTSGQSFASSDQKPLLDKEVNFQMENKVHTKKKSSGKTHLITLLYKKMTRKHDRKLKNSSSAAELLRTFSIHHLECNDYVLPDETTSNSEYSPSEKVAQSPRDSEVTTSSKQRELYGTYSIKKHSGSDNKEQGQKVALLSRNNKNSHSVPNTIEEPLQNMEPVETIKVENSKTVFNRLKDLKQRIKNAIKENKKEERRITMDGVLDKVPFGHKLAEDVETEKRSQSINSPRKRFLSEGSISFNNKVKDGNIQRSRSLTESLDRYSHLLESISVREPQRLPERLKTIRQHHDDSEQRRVLRSQSLKESFDRYSRMLESKSVKDPKRQPERLKSIREDDLLLDRSPLKTFKRIFSNPEVESYSFSSTIQNEMLHADVSLEGSNSMVSATDAVVNTDSSDEPKSGKINIEENIETNRFVVEKGEYSASERTEGLNHPALINEHDQSGACIASDDLDSITNYQHEDDCKIIEDQGGKSTKPSPVSVLDSNFEEYPVTAANFIVMQAGEHYSAIDQESNFVNSDHKTVELMEADSDIVSISSSRYTEDAEFNYVRDILKKSGFDGGAEDFLAAWYSSYEPVDQLICMDEESSPDELEGSSSIGTFEDQHLLVDLVNEVLLEIYESTIAYSVGILRFCPRIRLVSVRDRVLDEVWEKVSWHRGSQQHISSTIEGLMVRDFAKNDGWMRLQQDIVEVGIEVEELILDNLVDEIILDNLVDEIIFDFVDV